MKSVIIGEFLGNTRTVQIGGIHAGLLRAQEDFTWTWTRGGKVREFKTFDEALDAINVASGRLPEKATGG